MSDSVRPHRQQPARLPCPWDSPARTLEWVAISFSNAWKWKVRVKSLSHIRLLTTPWTAAYQASPSMGFSRQEYWSGLPLLSPLCCTSGTKTETNTDFNYQYIDVLEQVCLCFSACSLTQHLAEASHMLLVVPQTTSCNEILNLYSIAMNHILT